LMRLILRAYCDLRPLLFVPTFLGQQGHPRIIAREVFADVHSMPESHRFSTIFQLRPTDVLYLETGEEAVVMDCDTERDYAALLAYRATGKAW